MNSLFLLSPTAIWDYLLQAHHEPYPSLFPGTVGSLADGLLHPITPLSVMVIYIVASSLANRSSLKKYNIPTWVLLLHNLTLAVYSGVSLYMTGPTLWRGLAAGEGKGNLTQRLCDPAIFEAGKRWFFLFYLSKFYEVADTAIIVLSGKKASVLQMYHHAGAMLCMWALVRWSANASWIFCVFNSSLHALMYSYYSLACVKIRVPLIIKKSLTTLQILQFIVGGYIAWWYYFTRVPATQLDAHKSGYCVTSKGARMATALNVAFLTPLTYLFVLFFIKAYLRISHRGDGKKIYGNGNGKKAMNGSVLGR